MPNFLRLRHSNPPEENRNSTAIYAADDGTLKQVASDGTVTNVAGAGSLPSPSSEGDVLTVVSGDWAGAAPGGGSQPGAVRVIPFPFVFDTPGLLDGVAAWTPAVNDVLLNAWIEVDTQWSTDNFVKADIGQYLAETPDTNGFFSAGNSPISLKAADSPIDVSGGYIRNNQDGGNFDLVIANTGSGILRATAPGKFVTTDALCVCASQEGTPGGTDPEATAGAAILYLVVATPA